MASLLRQLKQRRLDLRLKQHDMLLRVGMSRQQYQRLESKGNPRADTLELIAKGLNSTVILIPNEKLHAVLTLLENNECNSEHIDITQPRSEKTTSDSNTTNKKSLADDPWQDLLDNDT